MSWGIIGAGAIAAQFAVAARAVGDPVAAVAARRREAGLAFARAFKVPTVVEDAAALVALPEVTAVYVATPTERHHDDTLVALAAGKPVLCEKPLAATAVEAEALATAARRAGVFLMEGLWSLCQPTYREAFATLASGALGRVREVHASFATPQVPETMPRLYDPRGGGALLDRGVYPIALARAVLGDLTLRGVTGSLDPNGVDLAVTMVLENAEGATAVLSTAIDRLADNRMTVLCEGGRIAFEPHIADPSGYRITRADPRVPFTGPSGLPGLGQRALAALKSSPRLMALARAALRPPRGRAHGLGPEIVHVRDCLAAGRTESAWVPLDESIAVLGLIDAVRDHLRAEAAAAPAGVSSPAPSI